MNDGKIKFWSHLNHALCSMDAVINQIAIIPTKATSVGTHYKRIFSFSHACKLAWTLSFKLPNNCFQCWSLFAGKIRQKSICVRYERFNHRSKIFIDVVLKLRDWNEQRSEQRKVLENAKSTPNQAKSANCLISDICPRLLFLPWKNDLSMVCAGNRFRTRASNYHWLRILAITGH